jgi:hypothetical protein
MRGSGTVTDACPTAIRGRESPSVSRRSGIPGRVFPTNLQWCGGEKPHRPPTWARHRAAWRGRDISPASSVIHEREIAIRSRRMTRTRWRAVTCCTGEWHPKRVSVIRRAREVPLLQARVQCRVRSNATASGISRCRGASSGCARSARKVFLRVPANAGPSVPIEVQRRIVAPWRTYDSNRVLFGMTLTQFEATAQPAYDRRAELANLAKRTRVTRARKKDIDTPGHRRCAEHRARV